ncbi:hypothetical protein [Colwellia hornerae]|uniref:Uncharacterized protein n=1 Tax=Colwellia hornerae TaxID=89402 RepID=A0A5C6QK09_9GAMM|nr:hypothetical protein [Colwellia hornerae]TWX53415.1 hypothetical protein ESZ28_10220 [Colwellia hornerae]TWX60235.1 hypothetical protein ESZ26_08995 [Colwellia hornerae]TWX68972.1 hypothetical protein ESZ27_06435 [Colwellia hornerae]
MGVGVKKLKEDDSSFTRKIVLFGVAILCSLFGLGLSLLVSLALLEPSTGQLANLLSSILFPVLASGYVLHYYYKHYFTRAK